MTSPSRRDLNRASHRRLLGVLIALVIALVILVAAGVLLFAAAVA